MSFAFLNIKITHISSHCLRECSEKEIENDSSMSCHRDWVCIKSKSKVNMMKMKHHNRKNMMQDHTREYYLFQISMNSKQRWEKKFRSHRSRNWHSQYAWKFLSTHEFTSMMKTFVETTIRLKRSTKKKKTQRNKSHIWMIIIRQDII